MKVEYLCRLILVGKSFLCSRLFIGNSGTTFSGVVRHVNKSFIWLSPRVLGIWIFSYSRGQGAADSALARIS